MLDQDAVQRFPVLEIGVTSKISCLCWNVYVKMCMLAADYDGGIQLWDVSTNSVTAQYEEHCKRVWSVDFSQACFSWTRLPITSDHEINKPRELRANILQSTFSVISVLLCLFQAQACLMQLTLHLPALHQAFIDYSCFDLCITMTACSYSRARKNGRPLTAYSCWWEGSEFSGEYGLQGCPA